MSDPDNDRTPPAKAPEPIGEVAYAIEHAPTVRDDGVARASSDVEPIGEVASAIERSSKPA
jgi:hypothetical protein